MTHDAATAAFYEDPETEFRRRASRATPNRHLAPFAARLAPGGHILDLGCGTGHDSEAFLKLGFHVTATDASRALARAAEARHGHSVRILTFDELDYVSEFDAVWASASLLHAESAALPRHFAAIWRALRPGGLFYASFKRRAADWRDKFGRHFCAMTEQRLVDLANNAGFRIETILKDTGTGSDDQPTEWLALIAEKPA